MRLSPYPLRFLTSLMSHCGLRELILCSYCSKRLQKQNEAHKNYN